MTLDWPQLRFHTQQSALWRSSKRFAAAACGRGSGKTELARRRLVRYLCVKKPWPNPMYFYGGPTERQAKRIAWNHILKLIPKAWIRGEPSASELTIHTVFGSSLTVVGLDKPQRIEGDQWDGCVLDESCDLKPGIFDLNILPALTHRDGWCWRIGVPKRHGVGRDDFKHFFDRGMNGDPTIDSFAWPSADILPESALAFAKSNLDPIDFREQFEATWEYASGQIFYSFDKDFNVRPVPYDPDKALIVGSDFNVNPMCWIIGHRWENRFEVFDEVFLRDSNTRKALDVLFQRYQDHRAGWEFYGDATGRARKTSAAISDYQQIYNDKRFAPKKIRYSQGNPLVIDRFAACNAMFCNADGDRRLFVDPNCKHLIRDLDLRGWKPGSREPNDSGDVGHITDALGYAIHKLYPIRVRISSTKSEVFTHAGTN